MYVYVLHMIYIGIYIDRQKYISYQNGFTPIQIFWKDPLIHLEINCRINSKQKECPRRQMSKQHNIKLNILASLHVPKPYFITLNHCSYSTLINVKNNKIYINLSFKPDQLKGKNTFNSVIISFIHFKLKVFYPQENMLK